MNLSMRRRRGIADPLSDRIFNAVVLIFTALILLVILYPLYFIVIASFSDPAVVASGKLLLFPERITLVGYRNILTDDRIWNGYRNTLLYVGVGTPVSLTVTILAAYALSRKDLPGRNLLMGLFVFTMYFGGGLVPLYMTVRSLHLIDNPAVVILLGAFSTYNMIIARSYFINSIPKELQEAASIDGCGTLMFFLRIVLPLSQPILAVIALYYAVGQWNSFFTAMIYLNNDAYYPLQMVLRSILLEASTLSQSAFADAATQELAQKSTEVIKYGVIVVSTVPIILLYPFLQRYFVKGVMIGSIKG